MIPPIKNESGDSDSSKIEKKISPLDEAITAYVLANNALLTGLDTANREKLLNTVNNAKKAVKAKLPPGSNFAQALDIAKTQNKINTTIESLTNLYYKRANTDPLTDDEAAKILAKTNTASTIQTAKNAAKSALTSTAPPKKASITSRLRKFAIKKPEKKQENSFEKLEKIIETTTQELIREMEKMYSFKPYLTDNLSKSDVRSWASTIISEKKSPSKQTLPPPPPPITINSELTPPPSLPTDLEELKKGSTTVVEIKAKVTLPPIPSFTPPPSE